MTTLLPITRAHGLEKNALKTMYTSFSSVKSAGLRLDRLQGHFSAIAWVTFQLTYVICVGFAAWCAITGFLPITAGGVVMLSAYFGMLVGSVLLLTSIAWTGLSRLVRGEFLKLRELEFVDAARVAGASNRRIIFKHILPNAVGVIIVSITLLMSGAILLETALSFLGFGVVAPDVSLGSLISQFQDSFTTRPWLFWWPGLLIITIALCINFIGDGLRDAFDPRQRRRLTKKDKENAKVQARNAAANV
jgi:ABC-type microcin C transport system permease subunit YejE